MKKHHKYSHTVVKHHDDGSHTVTHHHEDGKSNKEYAVANHDGMIDGMMDHTSPANPGEEAANAGPVGAAGASPAGMPPPAGA